MPALPREHEEAARRQRPQGQREEARGPDAQGHDEVQEQVVPCCSDTMSECKCEAPIETEILKVADLKKLQILKVAITLPK